MNTNAKRRINKKESEMRHKETDMRRDKEKSEGFLGSGKGNRKSRWKATDMTRRAERKQRKPRKTKFQL